MGSGLSLHGVPLSPRAFPSFQWGGLEEHVHCCYLCLCLWDFLLVGFFSRGIFLRSFMFVNKWVWKVVMCWKQWSFKSLKILPMLQAAEPVVRYYPKVDYLFLSESSVFSLVRPRGPHALCLQNRNAINIHIKLFEWITWIQWLPVNPKSDTVIIRSNQTIFT